jgi:hypothetical protein
MFVQNSYRRPLCSRLSLAQLNDYIFGSQFAVLYLFHNRSDAKPSFGCKSIKRLRSAMGARVSYCLSSSGDTSKAPASFAKISSEGNRLPSSMSERKGEEMPILFANPRKDKSVGISKVKRSPRLLSFPGPNSWSCCILFRRRASLDQADHHPHILHHQQIPPDRTVPRNRDAVRTTRGAITVRLGPSALTMPKVILDQAQVVAAVGEREAAGVPQHVRMCWRQPDMRGRLGDEIVHRLTRERLPTFGDKQQPSPQEPLPEITHKRASVSPPVQGSRGQALC